MPRRTKVVATIAITVWSMLLVPLAVLAVLTDPELSESLGVSDQVRITLTATVRPALNEAVAVGDTVATALRKTFGMALADLVTVGDQVVTTLSAAMRPSLHESTAVADQVAIVRSGNFRPALGETVSIGDALSVQLRAAQRPSPRDTATVIDQLVISRISAPVARVNDLTTMVTNASLDRGTTSSLMASLDAARSSLANEKSTAACGQLSAFANKVRAQAGKFIPLGLADSLIATAAAAERSIPCR